MMFLTLRNAKKQRRDKLSRQVPRQFRCTRKDMREKREEELLFRAQGEDVKASYRFLGLSMALVTPFFCLVSLLDIRAGLVCLLVFTCSRLCPCLRDVKKRGMSENGRLSGGRVKTVCLSGEGGALGGIKRTAGEPSPEPRPAIGRAAAPSLAAALGLILGARLIRPLLESLGA